MLRLTALIPFALVACVNTGDEGMYVVNATAASGGTCTFTGSVDQPFISHGHIDYLSPAAYELHPLIQSRITGVGAGSGSSTTDDISRTIQLRGADISLTLKAVTITDGDQVMTTQKDTVLPAFSTLFSGAVPPGGTVNVGVDTIPTGTLRSIGAMSGADLTSTTQRFDAEVVATVTIKGEVNGDTIASSPFVFPINVCSNCVFANAGTCPMKTAPRTGDPCNMFQDGIVDCCLDTTVTPNKYLCPGTM
jgi:hypothetical protein